MHRPHKGSSEVIRKKLWLRPEHSRPSVHVRSVRIRGDYRLGAVCSPAVTGSDVVGYSATSSTAGTTIPGRRGRAIYPRWVGNQRRSRQVGSSRAGKIWYCSCHNFLTDALLPFFLGLSLARTRMIHVGFDIILKPASLWPR